MRKKKKVKSQHRNYAADMPGIYQVSVEKLHRRNKRQMCPFCQVPQSNFVPHLRNAHKGEEEVDDAMALEAHSAERAYLLNILRYRGNHYNNLATLKAKRTAGKWRVSDFSPCPKCNKWLQTGRLWRHRKVCIVNVRHPDPTPLPLTELILQSEIIAGKISSRATDALKKEVFTTMRNDEIGRVAKKDPMIVMMGNSAMNRGIGNIAMRRYTVSGVIRLLARLLIELRALQPTEELKKNLTFYEALHPSQYDNFIHAVFAVCKEESVEEAEQDEQIETEPAKLQAPSNAIKLSYYIQKLCRMKVQLSIDSENRVLGEENRKATKRFMDKYKASWEVDVKKRARHVLRERKLNAMTELPDQINTEKVHQVTFRGN